MFHLNILHKRFTKSRQMEAISNNSNFSPDLLLKLYIKYCINIYGKITVLRNYLSVIIYFFLL